MFKMAPDFPQSALGGGVKAFEHRVLLLGKKAANQQTEGSWSSV